MIPAPEREPPTFRPLRLLVVVVLSSAVFLVGLSVAAFLTRDAHDAGAGDAGLLVERGSPGHGGAPPIAPDITAAPAPGLSPEAVLAALQALEPVARRCLVESRRQDPGIGDDLQLEVPVSISSGEGALGAPSVPPGVSPFLRGCLLRAVPRVRFPFEGEGEGTLSVRVKPEGVSLRNVPDGGAPSSDGGTP